MLAIVLGFLAVVAAMTVNEAAFQTAEKKMASVRARNLARQEAIQLRALLVDCETAVRGYLLTGRDEYLQPKIDASADVEQVLQRLRSAYDTPEWKLIVTDLERQTREMLDLIDEKVRMYQSGRHDAWRALLMSNLAKERMDAVRVATVKVDEHEVELLALERPLITRALAFGRYGIHLLALLSLGWWLYYLRRNEESQRALRLKAQVANTERDLLDKQVRQRTLELSELARHLTQVREDERSHLARELHDELGALLSAAKLDVARIRRMATQSAQVEINERLLHMGALIDEGIALKRRIIEDLRPSSLSNLGLVPALEILTREFSERSGLAIHTECSEVDCDERAQLAIYRLVQEALTNVHKHARAKNVWVQMGLQPEGITCSVRDDGQGFQPQPQSFGHHGLLGMRYRMESLGGVLSVTSTPGQGTEVRAQLPLQNS